VIDKKLESLFYYFFFVEAVDFGFFYWLSTTSSMKEYINLELFALKPYPNSQFYSCKQN
jgi:hypothetical protein